MIKILYISKLDWFRTKQRPQQLVEQLASTEKVDFLSVKPWKKKDSKLDTVNNVESKIIKGKLTIYRKHVMPKRESTFGEKLSDIIMRRFIRKLMVKEQYDVIVSTKPHQVKYLNKDIACQVIYD